MNTKERVEKYLQWGYNVLPAKDGAKYPVKGWQKYQSERYPREEIEEWLNHGKGNWVVVCGKISGNLLVLDFDEPKIYEEFKRKIEPKLLDTFMVKTGKKGYHIHYRTQEPVNSTKMGKVDILGEGKLAVLPPSIHPETGQRYEVINDREPLKIGNRELEEIFSVLREITGPKTPETGRIEDYISKIVNLIAPYWVKGHRNDIEYGLIGYMRKKGIPKNVAKRVLKAIMEVTGDDEQVIRMAVLERTYKKPIEKVKGYKTLEEGGTEKTLKNAREGKGDLFKIEKRDLWKLEKYVKALAEAGENTAKEEEEDKKGIEKVFVYTDDDIYLSVWDGDENYKFTHLSQGGGIELLDMAKVNGKIYYPKKIEMNKNGTMLPIAYPSFDVVNAPDVETNELFEVLKKHIYEYVDLNDDDLEMSVFYIMSTWFYPKNNTTAYLRFLGDTGKGKSRMLKVIGDLCFYPLSLGGNSSRSAIMRTQEDYHGTLILDESDFKGDKENEMTKYINTGFEKGKPIILTNKNTGKREIYDPFGPKLFAMRHPFRDSATEGRVLSIEPEETMRKDIKKNLPLKYEDKTKKLRDILARWTLKNWSRVRPDSFEMIETLPIEPRLIQLATPLSIILPLFEGEMSNKFVNWLLKRQQEIAYHRANSDEGFLFNTIVEQIEKIKEEDGEKPKVITTGILKELTGISPRKIRMLLEELGFEVKVEHYKVDGKRVSWHVIKLKNTRRWLEDWRRYKWGEEIMDIPEFLKEPRRVYEDIKPQFKSFTLEYELKSGAVGADGADVRDTAIEQKDRIKTLKGYSNDKKVGVCNTTAPTAPSAPPSSLADKSPEKKPKSPEKTSFIKRIVRMDNGKPVDYTLIDVYGLSDEITTPEEQAKFLEGLKEVEIPLPSKKRLLMNRL